MKLTLLFLFFVLAILTEVQSSPEFPSHWWQEVPDNELASWEINPSSVKLSDGEVILSKRNELGLLSNFASTPFEFEGKKYATIEGFWQSMKYPENDKDERWSKAQWPFKRVEVEQMQGFDAKKAGSFASKVMKEMDINYVTYKGKKLDYKTPKKAEHYQIIKAAMIAKMRQNAKVLELLLATKKLKLMPDHTTSPSDPPAWKYYKIWMEIRSDLQN